MMPLDAPTTSYTDTIAGPDLRTIVDAADYVGAAQADGNLAEALTRAQAVITRLPELAYGYAVAASLHLVLGAPDDAERVVTEGLRRSAGAMDLLAAGTEIAIQRSDWSGAQERHAALMEHAAASAALGSARLAGWGQRIDAGLRLSGRDASRLSASEAERAGQWNEALTSWTDHDAAAPGDRAAALGAARCHEKLGHASDADAILAAAIRRHPHDAELWATHALVAARRNDWPDAILRWQEFARYFPDLRAFDGEAAIALAQAGRFGEAEAALSVALAREPGSRDLRIKHAIVAQLAENWTEATRRWDEVVALVPDDRILRDLRGEAILQRDFHNEQNGTPEDIAAADPDREASLAEIVMDFESFGDNCEFGLVQRHYGAEPSGLLRFSAIRPEKVVELLRLRFTPIGDPEHTVVEDDEGEYIVRDDRGYYFMHTFARTGFLDTTRFLKQQHARMTLFKRKLVAQLTAGGRICVCKDSDRAITDDMLWELATEIGRYGNNIVLGARLATDEWPGGSVQILAPNVLVGYLPTLFLRKRSLIDFDAWASIVRQAHAYRSDWLNSLQVQDHARIDEMLVAQN